MTSPEHQAGYAEGFKDGWEQGRAWGAGEEVAVDPQPEPETPYYPEGGRLPGGLVDPSPPEPDPPTDDETDWVHTNWKNRYERLLARSGPSTQVGWWLPADKNPEGDWPIFYPLSSVPRDSLGAVPCWVEGEQ